MSRLLPILGLTALGLGLAVACNEQNFYPIQLGQSHSETIQKLQGEKVNILWVIDDTTSMEEEWAQIRTHGRAFTQILKDTGVQFTLGVSVTYNGLSWDFRPQGQLLGTPAVLTSDVPDWEQKFLDRIPTDHGPGGEEHCFEPVYRVLDPDRLQGQNRGFYQEGGYLLLVFLTDADDETQRVTRAEMLQRIEELYPLEKVRYFGIVCLNNSDCDTEWNHRDRDENELVKLSKELKGGLFPHDLQDYTPILEEIGKFVADLPTLFYLESIPVPESLYITRNGKKMAAGAENGWTYDSTINAIRFHGAGRPSVHEDIKIYYDPKKL